MIWIVQQQQISNPRMSHIKISVVLLIVTLALGQTGEQAQGHAQPNAEVVQKTEQQINAQPIAVQPVVVQPVPVEPHLPNIINPQPVGQGGTDIPLPQPIPVQPILSDPATQPQAQAQQHVQPQPVNNEQPAQPVQTQQHQQQPQVIHIQHNTQQQQTQHTQAQQTQQTHETQQQAQQVHQTQQGNQTPQGTQQQTQQGAGYRPNVAAQQHQGNHAGNPNRPNYDNPDAQRSAKYKAQQERLNQIRRKQRQLQEKRAQEMGVGPNPHIQIDRKINQNQLVRNQQRQKLHNLLQQQLQSGIAFPKKTVMFQVDKQIEQYVITPTTEIMITLRVLIYVLENNAYGFVKDIDKSKSLKVFVYEDNARIAAQTQFYFESAVKFLAKPKSTYIVRFYNQGVLKLVSLTYPNMLQAMQMQNLYSKQKGLQQITKTQMISMRIEQVTQRLRRNSLLDRVNNDTMMGFLRKYSGYQFVEMLIVIIISAFQVHLVKNMFQTDSIL